MTFIEPETVIEEARRWLARSSDSAEGAEQA
jgi:hypothetical protein